MTELSNIKMSEYIRKEMEWDILLPKLLDLLKVKEEEDEYLQKMNQYQICSQMHVHRLYAIMDDRIANQDPEVLSKTIEPIYIIPKLDNFLSNQKSGLMDERMLEVTFEEMVELVGMILTLHSTIQIQNLNRQHAIGFLMRLYLFASNCQVKNMETIKEWLLGCLSILRKKYPDQISDLFYANLLLDCPNVNLEFFDFFHEILYKEILEEQVLQVLLDAYVKRIPLMMKSYSESNVNYIMDALSEFTNFLANQPTNSRWQMIFIEGGRHSIFIDTLMIIATKNVKVYELSSIFNSLVGTYFKSTLQSSLKYELILNIFKSVIQKSSALFVLINTKEVEEERSFLTWFVETELLQRNQEQIVSDYLSNRHGLEFMLLMMIYYLYHYPQAAYKLNSLMTSINLLEEAKYFMKSQQVRDFLRIFYDYIHEKEVYDVYEANIVHMDVIMEM